MGNELNFTEGSEVMENGEVNLSEGAENVGAGSEETPAKVQSAEDNRRFADMRRKNENRELKSRMENYAKQRGFSSFAELERHDSENLDAEYKEKFEEGTGIGYDIVREAIKREINNHPDVIAARKMLSDTEEENIRRNFEKELKEISNISGIDIQTADDLRSLPNFEEFDSLARQGVGILNAFKVSHTEMLISNAEKKAAQKTLNNISSKGHLTATKGSSGSSDVIVPEDIKEQYKIFNPGITDEEIVKDYAKAMKRKG